LKRGSLVSNSVFGQPPVFRWLTFVGDFLDPFKVTTNEIVANARGVYDQVIRRRESVTITKRTDTSIATQRIGYYLHSEVVKKAIEQIYELKDVSVDNRSKRASRYEADESATVSLETRRHWPGCH